MHTRLVQSSRLNQSIMQRSHSMPSQTNEQALEALIEKALTGSSREERKEREALGEPEPIYGPRLWLCSWPFRQTTTPNSPWIARSSGVSCESTQPEELDKLKDRPNWQRLLAGTAGPQDQEATASSRCSRMAWPSTTPTSPCSTACLQRPQPAHRRSASPAISSRSRARSITR